MDNNINTLLKAYEITNNVFYERGYGENQVDLMQYLRTGNVNVFTSTKGARESIETIPFEEMTASVKKAIIDGTISSLSADTNINRPLSNTVPERVKLWAIDQINQEGYTTFNQLYSEVAKRPRNPQRDNLNLVSTLIESKRYSGLQSLKDRSVSKETMDIIQVLENQKVIIDEELERKLKEGHSNTRR